jgi:hypothetical protein
MQLFERLNVPCLGLALVLLCAALVAGCVSLFPDASDKSVPQLIPEKTFPIVTLQTTYPIATRQTTQNQIPLTLASQAAFNSPNVIHIANPDIDITFSCPRDWMIGETDVRVVRDYGRNVLNIATLYSPEITSDRISAAGSNPDKQRYTSFAIDVDPDAITDFERYFNLATLAVERQYDNVEITKRDVLLKISVTDTFPGYKSYELDFDAKDIRGKYIFTNVDGTVYIFAYRNPSPYSKEVEDIYKSIVITKIG